MKTNKRHQQKSGSALLTVMVIVTIISLTAGSFYIFAASMAQNSRQMTETIRAQTIAEAGAHLAYSQLKQNFAWRPSGEFKSPCGEGTFSLHVIDRENHQARVISVGDYKGARSIIGMDLFDANRPPPHVVVPGRPLAGGADSPAMEWPEDYLYWASLNYALFANGDLRFNGSPTVNGHMHANWALIMNGNDNGFVAGSLVSGQPVDSRIGTQFHAQWRKIPFPQLTDPEFLAYRNEAQSSGKLTALTGDQVYHRHHVFNGITIIDGDVILRGSGTRVVNGMLYVTGDITANGSAELIVNGTVMAGGNITLNGAAGVHTHDYVSSGGPVGEQAIASAIEVGPVNATLADDVMQFTDSNADVRLAGWWQGTNNDIPVTEASSDSSGEG